MRSRLKSTILWALWLAVIWVVLTFFIHETLGATNKNTQGSGAEAMMAKNHPGIDSIPDIDDLPAVPSIVASPSMRHFYAVTAISSTGFESAMSTEVSTTNNPVTLAWDAPPWTNQLMYAVHRGTNSGKYTQTYSAGTNLVLRVPPKQPTNVVITISGKGYLLVLTNPPGNKMFKGTNMTITKRYQ